MNTLEKILEEIKALKEKQNSSNQDYYTGYLSALSTVEGIIAGMDCGWIPVTERLPEEGEIVLVTIHRSEYAINYKDDLDEEGDVTGLKEEYLLRDGFRNCDGWYYYSNDNLVFLCVKEAYNEKVWTTDTVTAWMPLPEPYKGE